MPDYRGTGLGGALQAVGTSMLQVSQIQAEAKKNETQLEQLKLEQERRKAEAEQAKSKMADTYLGNLQKEFFRYDRLDPKMADDLIRGEKDKFYKMMAYKGVRGSRADLMFKNYARLIRQDKPKAVLESMQTGAGGPELWSKGAKYAEQGAGVAEALPPPAQPTAPGPQIDEQVPAAVAGPQAAPPQEMGPRQVPTPAAPVVKKLMRSSRLGKEFGGPDTSQEEDFQPVDPLRQSSGMEAMSQSKTGVGGPGVPGFPPEPVTPGAGGRTDYLGRTFGGGAKKQKEYVEKVKNYREAFVKRREKVDKSMQDVAKMVTNASSRRIMGVLQRNIVTAIGGEVVLNAAILGHKQKLREKGMDVPENMPDAVPDDIIHAPKEVRAQLIKAFDTLPHVFVEEVVQGLSRILAQGVPTEHQMRTLSPKTAEAWLRKWKGWVKGGPEKASLGEFLMKFAETIQREKERDKTILSGKVKVLIGGGYSHLFQDGYGQNSVDRLLTQFAQTERLNEKDTKELENLYKTYNTKKGVKEGELSSVAKEVPKGSVRVRMKEDAYNAKRGSFVVVPRDLANRLLKEKKAVIAK